ncbi:helix-turn-helix domain-containing protein [Mesobacillus sp. AQ2]|jgi:PucR family transcriptional regulator, purine catabolism regulatory protein|uniref:PucR family transcriptional regulator n=1 Tax=unclassified Mesobacillus TaxID=2675270 RepID=UPI00203EA592|nr:MULTISPECIES: helix-turn-helix domain-containing protein [unclassified Mesobacillus]MCM3124971.1 helix-turn-helix domain-containing protein [Mesobacillus sp. MER 33]MCM3235269.1 helix-turn-helix domain-containing protein [Mesobacillus sp. MER 48]WHX39800.1 helix-turn-helix domain-containing protein [Mesobacillus sp. AQ2]
MERSACIPEIATELTRASHENITFLIQKVSDLSGKAVILTNSHNQLISSALKDPYHTIGSIMAIQQLEQHKDPSFSLYELITDSYVYWGWGTVVAYDNNILGYLYLVDSEIPIMEVQTQTLMSLASLLIASKLQMKLEIRQEKLKFKEPFLFDLLYGNLKQKDEILEHAQIWNWDFSLQQAVLVFALRDFNHYATDKKLINKLLYIVERTVVERQWEPITMKRGNQVSLILTAKKEDQMSLKDSIRTIAEIILKEMDRQETERFFSCGIGKTYSDPRDLFRSFQEAKVALEIGELLDIQVPYFEELGLERILYKHDTQDLKEYYETILGKMINYDSIHHTDFTETLEAYVTNQFDMVSTSQALFLHKNTLRYRLKKIEEILGYKLDDINNRLNVSAAFKIKKMRKI